MIQMTESEQLASNPAAARARSERDQKQFVRQLFSEFTELKNEIAELKAMVAELACAKKAKKEAAKEE
jgi:hypothetical protein